MRVAIAGLTHLGICMAIAAHEAGLTVIGWDLDADRVEAAQQGRFDPAEPGVADFLSAAHDRFTMSTSMDVLQEADLVVVAVDTTLLADGTNDESEVSALLRACARTVAPGTPIVIASQVRPGFTRTHAHVHDALYYFMETLIFGRGLERAMHPERFIIGVPDSVDRRLEHLPPALRTYLEAWHCPVHLMSYESAELTKLSANVVLAASVTAANTLAELAASLGASWPDIERALRDDARIGPQAYLAAGLGIGGANIGRDLEGIRAMADEHGLDSSLARTMLAHSAYMRGWVIRAIARLRAEGRAERVAVLGLAYKPGTTSIRGSAGMDCVRVFAGVMPLTVFDPAVSHVSGAEEFVSPSIDAAVAHASLIVITTPWPEFAEPVDRALRSDRRLTVLDPHRLLPRDSERAGTLIQLGVADV